MSRKIQLPDYKNCSVNVISSVCKSYKVNTGHPGLPLVDSLLNPRPKNVVILVLDGMGEYILKKNLSADSFLRKHQVGVLSSVFPSTTTTGTMCFKTGLQPIEHGWISLFLYFKEVGEAVNLYLSTNAYSKKPVSMAHVANEVLSYANILELISERNAGSVRTYALSIIQARAMDGVSQIIYQDFSEMCGLLSTLCQTEESKVIYAYHDCPDNVMHQFGPYSRETAHALLDIDAELANLAEKCPDTLFLISADHGQIEVDEVIDLANYPDLVSTLLMPPTGDARAKNFFVKPGRHSEFERLIKKYLPDKFALFSKAKIAEMGLLGDAKPHVKIDDFVGDFWLVSTGNANLAYSTLYKLPVKEPRGSHGGLTKEEMTVPLIAVRTK